MKKALLHPLFLIASALFLANYILEGFNVYVPYWNCWGDDILCLPVVLSLLNAALAWKFRVAHLKLSYLHIGIAIITVSVLFEIILPAFSAEFTQDPFDVLAYFIGGVLYAGFHLFDKQKPLPLVQ